MATFPDVKYSYQDLSEKPESVVERTEMERGIPKQRRFASDARVELKLTVYFDTKAEAAAFEDWFYGDIQAGQSWFGYTHPRTGAVVQARIVNGELGELKFENPTREASKRTLTLEYWRSTW